MNIDANICRYQHPRPQPKAGYEERDPHLLPRLSELFFGKSPPLVPLVLTSAEPVGKSQAAIQFASRNLQV